LGILTMLLGIGTAAAVKACLVFLVAHAFYKGALFMVAGAVDHETGTRDLTRLGGLRHAMPITTVAAFLAALSLAAFGPVLSFIGKEQLFEAVLHWEKAWVVLIPVTVAGASIFVVGAWLAGIRPFSGAQTTQAHHEAPATLWVSPLLLAILGVLFGVWPQLIETRVLAPAVSSVLGEAATMQLALWHGFNLPLVLSLASVALGFFLVLGWKRILGLAQRFQALLRWGPERWYNGSLAGLLRFAALQTNVLQSGYLRLYILTIVLFTAALAGGSLLGRQGLRWTPQLADWRIWEAGIAVLILLAAVMVTLVQSRLAVIAALSVVGYGVALIFVLFGAPDLAVTQFLVETLVLVLLVVAFYRLPRFAVISSRIVRCRDLIIAVAFGGLMAALVLGAASHEPGRDLARFYSERSVPEAKGRNVVNVILVDFRALDTLGEITVLVTAAVGVFALLRLRPSREDKE
ncbi:MAG TPA: hydrogen gas-evolving membrane-bound hydrogenase subunit E, partial [Clostridia bacterium]|nr:hydrogen gas-evolving membrane-bound hydrogenase subunit E [Clostridia bacterium]